MEPFSKTLKGAKEAGPLVTMIVLLGLISFWAYKIATNHLTHVQASLEKIEISSEVVEAKLDNLRQTQVEQTNRLIEVLKK